MNDTIDTQEPWYRNPWVWLLIAIPSMTVVGCMLTIRLFGVKAQWIPAMPKLIEFTSTPRTCFVVFDIGASCERSVPLVVTSCATIK